MKTISVVVPIYNVESFLGRCLDSLYSQVDETVEVILVNDGSTDGSLAICREYKAKNSATTLIVDKPNGGLSDARNAGTAIASGKYIYYLDADDWLAPNALTTLYRFAEANSCEVVQGGFYYAYSNYLLLDERQQKATGQYLVLSRQEVMKRLIENSYIKNFAWGKLYLTDIVKRHPFKRGVCFEDAYWQHLIVDDTNRYGVVATPLYFYWQRADGISGSFNQGNLDLLRGYECRLAFVREHYPELTRAMLQFFWNISHEFHIVASRQSDKHVRQIFDDYWSDINLRYHDDFSAALSSSLEYKIDRYCPCMQSAYSLYKRIRGRLFGKRLTRIEIKE